jgi:hypothetical protein
LSSVLGVGAGIGGAGREADRRRRIDHRYTHAGQRPSRRRPRRPNPRHRDTRRADEHGARQQRPLCCRPFTGRSDGDPDAGQQVTRENRRSHPRKRHRQAQRSRFVSTKLRSIIADRNCRRAGAVTVS